MLNKSFFHLQNNSHDQRNVKYGGHSRQSVGCSTQAGKYGTYQLRQLSIIVDYISDVHRGRSGHLISSHNRLHYSEVCVSNLSGFLYIRVLWNPLPMIAVRISVIFQRTFRVGYTRFYCNEVRTRQIYVLFTFNVYRHGGRCHKRISGISVL